MLDEKQATTLDDILREINEIKKQNNSIVNQNNEMKNELGELKRDLDTIRFDINICKNEISSVIQTQEFQAKQFDVHRKQQDNLLTSHTGISNNCELIKSKIKSLEIKLLEDTVTRSHSENNSRKINVEISGVPITKDEDCKSIVVQIGKSMGSKLTISDVDVAHRSFQNNPHVIPNIIAKFHSRTIRDEYFFKRPALKSLTLQNMGLPTTTESAKTRNKVYINESLSIYTKQIFKLCRDKCKELKYNCFVNGGIIYIKKDDLSSKTRINNVIDIETFLT